MAAQEALNLREAYGDVVSLPQIHRDMGLARPLVLIERRRETSQSASHAPDVARSDSASANKDLGDAV
jgi:hypothetical protein